MTTLFAQSVLPNGNTLWLGTEVPSKAGDGSFSAGDMVFVMGLPNSQGRLSICTVGGAPGTWKAVSVGQSGSGTFTNFYTAVPANLTVGDGHNGFTDTTGVANQIWVAAVLTEYACTLTGIGFLIGSTGGTDKACVALYDGAGVLLAQSAAAGVTVGTNQTFQKIPFTAPVSVAGPALHFIAVQTNGTTAKIQTQAAGIHPVGIIAGAGGTFGTFPALTVPTSFTAAQGPVAATY